MKLQPKESQIQRAILDYLKLRGIFCWRNNSLAVPIIDKYNRRHYIRTGMKGLPDIFCLLPSVLLMLEVKTARGKLSDEQKAFFEKAKELGHYCVVVKSVEDVEKILEHLNL